MLKRFLGVAGLAMVAAVGAQAQSTIHYSSGPDQNSRFANFMTGVPSTGNFGTNSFQVWCVDQKNQIAGGNNYLVNVARLDGAVGSLATTRLGAGSSDTYARAAYLAATMGGAPNTGASVNNKQYAIWAVIHSKTFAQRCESWDGDFDASNADLANCSAGINGNDAGSAVGTVGKNIADANAGYMGINKAQWYILTGVDGCGPTFAGGTGCGNDQDTWASSGMQELIAHCNPLNVARTRVTPPTSNIEVEIPRDNCEDGFTPPNDETPTPEPATMSLLAMGLVGLAGKSLRRRNK